MRVVTLDGLPGADGQPLFVDFVNTLHWYEGVPIELIGDDADFTVWLAERGLPVHDVTGCLPAVHLLRGHARAVTEALAARRPRRTWQPSLPRWLLLTGTWCWLVPTHHSLSWRSVRTPQTLCCSPSRSRCRSRCSSSPAID